VTAEEGQRGAAQDKVLRGDERVGDDGAAILLCVGRVRVDAGGVLEVERDVVVPERRRRQSVKLLLRQAGALGARVEVGGVVEDREGAGSGDVGVSRGARVVLDAVPNGDLDELEA
jgi:hypothetical protein